MNLPTRLIIDHGSDTLQHWEWTPPPMPHFAGPRDLAALVVSYRQRLADIQSETGKSVGCRSQLGDAGLERLLDIAYKSSFLTEEGRPVRACLYSPPGSDPSVSGTAAERREDARLPETLRTFGVRLAEWVRRERVEQTNSLKVATSYRLDDPKDIVRLAPTLTLEDAVLVVEEAGDGLVGSALTLLDFRDAENQLLGMPRGWQGVGGLFVHILGPGELRVSEGGGEYTLRANEVRVYSSACQTKHAWEWLQEANRSLMERATRAEDWEAKESGLLPAEHPVDLMVLWSLVLREAASMRHGGAFVVVPDRASAPIALKYPLDQFDLGGEIVRVWLSLCRLKQGLRDGDVLDRAEDKRRCTHKLCSAGRLIGRLAATDGCVVLDRALILHGFGGSIDIDTEVAHVTCVQVIGLERRSITEADIRKRFGQRHWSAFSLCKKVPGTIAFVISQDGDLRVFAGDGSTVFLYDLLHP